MQADTSKYTEIGTTIALSKDGTEVVFRFSEPVTEMRYTPQAAASLTSILLRKMARIRAGRK